VKTLGLIIIAVSNVPDIVNFGFKYESTFAFELFLLPGRNTLFRVSALVLS